MSYWKFETEICQQKNFGMYFEIKLVIKTVKSFVQIRIKMTIASSLCNKIFKLCRDIEIVSI